MELANNPFIVRVNPNGLSIFFLEDADSPYDLGSYFAELNDRPQEKAALIAILRDIAACGIEENGAVVSGNCQAK